MSLAGLFQSSENALDAQVFRLRLSVEDEHSFPGLSNRTQSNSNHSNSNSPRKQALQNKTETPIVWHRERLY